MISSVLFKLDCWFYELVAGFELVVDVVAVVDILFGEIFCCVCAVIDDSGGADYDAVS